MLILYVCGCVTRVSGPVPVSVLYFIVVVSKIYYHYGPMLENTAKYYLQSRS